MGTDGSQSLAVAGLLALVAVELSCHVGDLLNGTTTGRQPVVPRQLAFTTEPSSAAVGTPVSTVRVSALDSGGALAPAFNGPVTVSLATNPGSGTLKGTLTETAVNGVATFGDLRIDKSANGYSLRAVATGLNAATSQAFDITPSQPPPPPPATRLRFTVQPPASTDVGQTMTALSVAALDASGAVVTTFSGAITVAILGNPGGGTLSGTLTVTAASGVATFATLSIDKPGVGYTLQATSAGLSSATSHAFTITAPQPPPAATRLKFTVQPTSTQTGRAIAPAVQVSALDSSGTVVSAFSGTIAVAIGTNPSGGTLSGTTSVTAVNGVASFSNLSINNAGTGYTLQATSSGLTSAISAAFDVTVAPPPPATQLRFTVQPTSTQAGQAIAPAIRVSALDASGTIVPSFTGTIIVAIGTNPSGGTLSGTTTANAVNGVASFSNLSINNAGTGYTLQATSSGLTSATSSAFDVTVAPPPPATQLRFAVQPQSTQAGQVIAPPVQVAALDASGALVTTFTGAITVAIGTNPAGGTLSGTATVNAANGVATFSGLSINNAGTGYTLQATSSGLTSATSTVFNITPAPPPPPPPATQLRFTVQPTSTQAGQAISPAVQVSALDASGTVVSSFTGAITVAIGTNPAGGTLSGTATVNAANGVATFSNLSINNAGTGYTLQGTSSGLASATSSAFDVTSPPPPPPPPATQLRFAVQPQSTQAGQAIAPPVQVAALDASGTLVTTFTGAITIAIGTNPAGGTLSGTLTVSAAGGVATFSDLSINNAGTGYTLQATSSGLTSATSSAFDVTSPPPPPPPPATQLRFAVQPQSTQAGQAIAPPVQVAALDASGTLVTTFTGAITIAIGTNPAGGTLSGTTTVNAAGGVATFSNLSITNAGTGYTLQATSSGLTSATSSAFDITAPPPPPPPPATQLGFTVQPSTTLPLLTITPAVEVTALDAQGNPVTGFTGAITIAIGHDASLLGNAVLSGTLTVNAVNGVARFSDLSIDQIGVGYTLRATASGLTTAESAAFTIGP